MLESSTEQLQKKPVSSNPETLIRVLHVDDDAEFLKCSKRILEMHDPFQIETALSVKEALQKLRQKQYDVIVADYKMPERNGLDILKELRDKGNDVPFILFTGKGREEVAIKALNLGADQYVNKIGKPEVVYPELVHAIRKVMKIREAETALQKSEENYRRLFENSPVVILTLDSKGNVTSINKVAEEYGFKKDEIVGKNMRKFVFKRYWPKLLKDLVQLSRGKTVEGEIEIGTPKGKKTAKYKSNPIIIDNKVVGRQVVLTDITERKTAEEKLRESEGKFRNLAEKSPNMIFINKKGRVVYANKRCEEIIGYKRKEFYSPDFDFFTLIAPESIELLKSGYSRHLKGEEILPYEYTLITKEGKRIEAILTSKLITYEGETAILGIITDITERKKMEKQLKESEEKYRKQFEEAIDAIVLADAETGIIVDCNLAATKLIGRKKSELVGKHQRILHPPESIEGGFSRTFKQHRKGKEGQLLETHVITKNGEIRDVTIKANILELGDKKIIQGIFRDITEQKRAEEALRESEEKYRELLNGMNDTAWVIDFDGNIVDVNDAATKVLGYSREEFRSIGLTGIDSNLDPEEIKGLVRGMPADEVQVFETLHTTKDGKNIPVEISSSLVTYKGKKAILSIGRNITERKKMEKQLKESEEKYRKQFEEAMDAIFLADAETGITLDCNRAATKLVGRKKSELVGKHQRILHPPESIEGGFSRTFEQHRKEKEAQVLEDRVITKNGEIRDVLINATTFELAGKRLIQATFRDVTNKKKMEEQLRQERETLELVTANIGAGLTIISKDYKILWANKFLKNICGEDLKGKTCYSVYADRTSVCPDCGIKEIFETEKNNVVHEQLVLGPRGQRVWVEITANPIRDKKGNIVAASALYVYVNERKQLENKLREAEKRYHAIFDKAPLGILIIDSNGTAVEFNEEANRQLGYSRDEFAKLTVCDYEVLENAEETRARMERTMKTGKDEFETKHRTKTGEIRDVRNTVQVIELSGKKFFQIITQDITERKRAEESLRESEEKYRELLNGMNDTAWVIDLDGSFLEVNDAAVEVLGYTREELLSMGPKDLSINVPEEDVKALIDNMPKDEIQVFEATHFTKDGRPIPVEISSSLVTYKGKQAILSIARDITERKKASEELRRSNERYRTVFENTGTAMCIINEDKTIYMVNRRFEKLFGYSWKELKGRKWTEFVTEDCLELMQKYQEARRKKGGKVPLQYSFDIVNKKGQIKNCMLSVNMIPGTRKSVVSVLDITESKKAEKALLDAEKKYRKTILSANVGIISYSPEGEVKILNPKMEQMTGFKKSEIPTLQHWFKKLYPNKEERCKIRNRWFKRMSEEGEVKEGHAIITTKDGKRRNFLFNAVRLESGDSVAFAEDITERKEAEKKFDKMMNELVAINEKLGVVGRLTRHDVRNKLSVIANNVFLAKQGLPANHSSLEFLGDTESAVDQIEKIFDFARNYEMLGVEELSLMAVGKSVEEAAILLSGINEVKLVNECRGLAVMADSLLRQLFYNLLDDSLKHGEKVSQIRVYYEEGEDQLKLVYEDDGVGIPEEEKELIFKEGYGKGTGYGLYLIKKMCEAYGWNIRETGKQGKGAQFTIIIPKINKNGKASYRLDD